MPKILDPLSKTFVTPDPNQFEMVTQMLETVYNNDDLLIIKRCIKPFFMIHLAQLKIDESLSKLISYYFSLKSPKNKRSYAEIVALIFSHPDNFKTYMSWLPKNAREIWKRIIDEKGISSKEMISDYSVYIPDINDPNFKMKRDTVPIFCFFSFRIYYTTSNYFDKKEMYYFYLPPTIYSFIVSLLLPPESYDLSGTDTIPETEALYIYENKQEILSNIPYITGLQQQGNIPLGVNGNVNMMTINAVTKRMNMSEFYNSVIKEASFLRAYLILIILKQHEYINQKNIPTDAFVRNLFIQDIPLDFGWLLPLLLNHIKGIRDLSKLENPGADAYLAILDQVRELVPGKWISVQNFMYCAHYSDIDFCPLPYSYLDKVYLKFMNEIIFEDNYYRLLTIPFVKSILFLFASFGIIDIAYEEYSLAQDSYYDSVKYFRLTELGEYLLGRKTVYTRIDNQEHKQYFEADDSNLIIRSLIPDNEYEKLLMEMAVPIGKSRFKISHTSILRSCKTAEDIENKINFFHVFICSEPSKIWEDFFNSVRMRANPLEEVKSDFRLYKINPENTELIRLIAQDPQVNKYVLKVENHHLLIHTQDLNKVTERLKTYGYLL